MSQYVVTIDNMIAGEIQEVLVTASTSHVAAYKVGLELGQRYEVADHGDISVVIEVLAVHRVIEERKAEWVSAAYRPGQDSSDGNGWKGDEHAEPGTRGWTA